MIPAGFKVRFGRSIGDSEVDAIEQAKTDLETRLEISLPISKFDDYGDKRPLTESVLAYRQMLLHRALSLFEGALDAAMSENVYSLCLNIRAHFETTAALGFSYKRLRSARDGHLEFATVHKDISFLILGSKEPVLSKAGAPSPKQILTMLEEADKAVSASILGLNERRAILSDCYAFLCEIAHPNFHSNSMSFDLDRNADKFVFRRSNPMREQENQMIRYLLISSPLFVALYDAIPELIAF
jgi:hypothetical protein